MAAKKTTQKAETPQQVELLSYRVTSPLRHNGERYKIDDLVELTVEQFERLRDSGVVTDEAAEG